MSHSPLRIGASAPGKILHVRSQSRIFAPDCFLVIFLKFLLDPCLFILLNNRAIQFQSRFGSGRMKNIPIYGFTLLFETDLWHLHKRPFSRVQHLNTVYSKWSYVRAEKLQVDYDSMQIDGQASHLPRHPRSLFLLLCHSHLSLLVLNFLDPALHRRTSILRCHCFTLLSGMLLFTARTSDFGYKVAFQLLHVALHRLTILLLLICCLELCQFFGSPFR